MRYTITDPITGYTSVFSIEKTEKETWFGYNAQLQMAQADVCYGFDRLSVYKNTCYLITKDTYNVCVTRVPRDERFLFSEHATSAFMWYKKREALFSLDAAYVVIDSFYKNITIYVPEEANVVEYGHVA